MKNYQDWIIDELESWKQTFNNQYPDHKEQVISEEKNSYDEIQTLIEKITKNECSKIDYENILFHLWQIKHES
ncbi:hypothetical protein [Tamlana sp. I1]|uniref:hypothetical protein n=1 Tax=Tamlana sp. I1 TaxID=2762061 RepID=UPI00188FFC5E|nr:hypothetical protein [Tamlana sp. I1]